MIAFHTFVRFIPVVLTLCASLVCTAELSLIPWPLSVQTNTGSLLLSDSNRIVAADPSLLPLVGVMTGEFAVAFGLNLSVAQNTPLPGDIILAFSPALTGETYSVTVSSNIVISSATYAGIAAGSVTLLQAIGTNGTQVLVPKITVQDSPFVSYRGLMVDPARQHHGVTILKKLITMCRLYKIRYLQLHLTDDQGFKFPTTNFPLLITQNYSGPAYTREELQELEAYSQARGVTLIPEFEIPGHEGAMNRTMPDLFKIKDTVPYEHHATINWAKPEVTNALDLIIGEICSIFKATPYFHIGGDEADYVFAHQNTNFILRFAELGYPQPYDSGDTYQLYRRLIRDMNTLISNKYNKQMLCWEGFHRDTSATPLEPIPKNIPVMAFENTYYPANYLAQDGYTIINTAWNPLYVVNGVQCSPEHIYGWNIYRFGRFQTDWNSVYWINITPTPLVIGAQMCSWEQHEDIEIPTLRGRLPAMSERIWNPDAGKSFLDFSNRFVSTDLLLSKLIYIKPNVDYVDVAGYYTNPNNEIGPGIGANMTADTTFGWQTSTCSIPVKNNGFTFTIDSGNGNDLNYSGWVIGSGNVELFMGPWSDPATWTTHNPLRLSGEEPNTASGTWYVKKGRVQLEKTDGVIAIGGDAIVGGQGPNDCFYWQADEQIIDSSHVTLLNSSQGGAYLNLNGHTETIAELTMDAGTVIQTDGTEGSGGLLRVGVLSVNGVSIQPGTYTSSESWIEGDGQVAVIPEPAATAVIFSAGLCRLFALYKNR